VLLKEQFQTIARRTYRIEDAELKAGLLQMLRSNPIYKPVPNGMVIKRVDVEVQSLSTGEIQTVVITEQFENE
jgi:hypothetical protein